MAVNSAERMVDQRDDYWAERTALMRVDSRVGSTAAK
jgi:hypothetical protein